MAVDINALFFALFITAAIGGAAIFLRWKKLYIDGFLLAAVGSIFGFYIVFSGVVSEFSGFGLKAKFSSVSATPVSDQAIEKSSILGAEALSRDLGVEAFMQRGQRVIAIDGDAWATLSRDQVREKAFVVGVSIYQSLLTGGFHGLIVLDRDGKPLGFFEKSAFLEVLRIPMDRIVSTGDDAARVLNPQEIRARFFETNAAAILLFPKVRAESEANKVWMRFDTSVIDVFREMKENRLDVVVLTDVRGEYVGIVSREALIDQMLEGFFSPL